jgi:hypothetical protein
MDATSNVTPCHVHFSPCHGDLCPWHGEFSFADVLSLGRGPAAARARQPRACFTQPEAASTTQAGTASGNLNVPLAVALQRLGGLSG